MRIISVVAMALFLFPAAATADSDGYFCVGRGYLAYEVRVASTPKHELRVVRFGSTKGIVPVQPISLDDFQVHGMQCRAATVDLVGWQSVYSVDIADSTQPPQITVRAAKEGVVARPPGNLGHWSQPQVLTLDADGEDQFQLVIARVSQRVAHGIEHHTVSRIIQRSPRSGREIVRSLQLFEGVFLETVD